MYGYSPLVMKHKNAKQAIVGKKALFVSKQLPAAAIETDMIPAGRSDKISPSRHHRETKMGSGRRDMQAPLRRIHGKVAGSMDTRR